jgi:hypothetical protein
MITRQRPDEQDSLTLGQHFLSLLPRLSGDTKMPENPADVFALAASALLCTGAYAAVMDHWPPPGRQNTWVSEVRQAGANWRENWGSSFTGLQQAWQLVLANRGARLAQLTSNPPLIHALLEMMAVADEACVNVGVAGFEPPEGTPEDEFYLEVEDVLKVSNKESATLCTEIHPSRAKVLPKMHTPQSGLTIRSFSLNLALVLGSEIKPKWHLLPESLTMEGKPLRILFVPWPFEVDPSAFRKVDALSEEAGNMPPEFGFFEYAPSSASNAVAEIADLLDRLKEQKIEYDMVVLPELALSQAEFGALQDRIVFQDNKSFLSGVRADAASAAHCGNQLKFGLPVLSEPLEQAKHHRWQLDKDQIEQYGLTKLSIDKKWWEHISLKDREFMFVSLDKGLVMSVLICEDLARPDPVGDLVRAVGPNLVIALLMDGPQISGRWPGRYAASLANDPGSSVLSITSLGMSALSRPRKGTKDRRRVVALWQHPRAGTSIQPSVKELELPKGHQALVLTIDKAYGTEWSADGRDDRQNAAVLHLTKWESVPLLTGWSRIRSWFG